MSNDNTNNAQPDEATGEIISAWCWRSLRCVPMVLTPPKHPDYEYIPNLIGWGRCMSCTREHAITTRTLTLRRGR